jgi:hypothetical protein
MGYGLALVIGVSPWWSPQYLIPVLGMVLGNTISGISVGLAAVMEELTTGGLTGTAVATAGAVDDGCTQCEAQKPKCAAVRAVHGGFDSSLHDALLLLLLLVVWLGWRVHASMPNDLPAMQCCAAAGADRIERLLSLGDA